MMISILPLDSAHVPVSFAVFLGWYGTEGHPMLPEAFSGVQSSQTVISLPLPRDRSWKNAFCRLEIQRSGGAIMRMNFKSEAYNHIVLLRPIFYMHQTFILRQNIYFVHTFISCPKEPQVLLSNHCKIFGITVRWWRGRGIITWI